MLEQKDDHTFTFEADVKPKLRYTIPYEFYLIKCWIKHISPSDPLSWMIDWECRKSKPSKIHLSDSSEDEKWQ